ncbi:peptidyl-prolyl cis-trans isomerase sig-7 [Athalia rosae]|uniref:peptidyl-prolyl cis-trans isomerase sig-7 n=1 Tax=Athalia rosae TaxID=37344 RepID=UPI00203402C4|nr:peptidyl-prolyl cis-trans isomerase sig-7 [Athalia rosae]
MAVVIETTVGDFTVDLFTDQRPQTCLNFLKLCKIKYYNWSLFHSVQTNFIAQTGDPTGTGKGGESVYGIVLGEEARYYEAEQMPKIKHDRTGLISMVNCGNNMLGSQFFITLGSELQSLDGQHCVFGEITEGLEVILKLNEAICDGDFRPYQDIRISHTVILEDPYDDPKGLVIPDRSPERTKEALTSDRIGADEVIDDTAGMTTEEIIELRKEREAKARATILEIVGDLPDADMAPPENVLFVCKLNPVTGDDDLEIIFSRFGKIIGCEVIRDRQSGDSLQYAFIEFADRKSCEDAYFKMDNVLIDDRRIHVDFSQSVSKMRWRGKGKGIQYYDDKEKVNQNFGNSKEANQKNGRGYRSHADDKQRERKCSLREESARNRHQNHRKDTVLEESHRKSRNIERRSRERETSRNDKRSNDSRDRAHNDYNRGRMEVNRKRNDEFDRDRLERNIKREDNYRGRDRREDNRYYNNNEDRRNDRDKRYREEIDRNSRLSNVRRNDDRKERPNNRWEENHRRKTEMERRNRNDGDGQSRYRNEDVRNRNGREYAVHDRKMVHGESPRESSKDDVGRDVQKNIRNAEKEVTPVKHETKSRNSKSSTSSEDSSSDSESDSSSESDQKHRKTKKKLKKRKHTSITSDDSSESDDANSKIKKKKRHKEDSDSDDSDDDRVTKKQIDKKQKLKRKNSSYETAKKKLKVKEKKVKEEKKKEKNKKSKKKKVSSSSESESSSDSSSSNSSESDSRKKKNKKSHLNKSKKIKRSKKSRKRSESTSSSD